MGLTRRLAAAKSAPPRFSICFRSDLQRSTWPSAVAAAAVSSQSAQPMFSKSTLANRTADEPDRHGEDISIGGADRGPDERTPRRHLRRQSARPILPPRGTSITRSSQLHRAAQASVPSPLNFWRITSCMLGTFPARVARVRLVSECLTDQEFRITTPLGIYTGDSGAVVECMAPLQDNHQLEPVLRFPGVESDPGRPSFRSPGNLRCLSQIMIADIMCCGVLRAPE